MKFPCPVPAEQPLARAVWQACVDELLALKPGNVGVHGDGHGMKVDDFIRSAACAAPALAAPGLSVGERVLRCVESTRRAVGCNTNLGIALLCAPIARAADSDAAARPLRRRLEDVLNDLTVDDTARVSQAITLAAPAGLGASPKHDVRGPPGAALREVMGEAADRDRIARQYASGFEDVFVLGLPALTAALERYGSREWATTRLYLELLCLAPDSHLVRKHGPGAADVVWREAKTMRERFERNARAADMTAVLAAWDGALKRRGLNPGTCADLTVATLFARGVQTLEETVSGDKARPHAERLGAGVDSVHAGMYRAVTEDTA